MLQTDAAADKTASMRHTHARRHPTPSQPWASLPHPRTHTHTARPQLWDLRGTLLWSSAPLPEPVTSVAWCPGRHAFAVGSRGQLLLCDGRGFVRSKVSVGGRPSVYESGAGSGGITSGDGGGSVLKVAWAADGLQLAAATAGMGGRGGLSLAHVTGLQRCWRLLEVSIAQPQELAVYDRAGALMSSLHRFSTVRNSFARTHARTHT